MEFLEVFTMPDAWIALITLTALEIVLGIDNIVFITILVAKLPAEQRDKARIIGLGAAMGMRIALLFSIAFIIGLTQPLFTVFDHEVSWRDIILVGGGLFLIAKATFEIHERLEGAESHKTTAGVATATFGAVIAQIMLLDIIFSLDSVITAIGMADDIPVMVAAIVIAVGVMLLSAKAIGEFVERHPTLKMLALAFLLLIGTALVAEGIEVAIPKGYIYFAMGFAVLVEFLNLRTRSRQPLPLRDAYVKERPADGPPGPA
ncbi:MAG TPA: TerC family protein [Candidatus Limnocylindrales bacterium]|nr:TerC family protein [Candidatus Limnocylindrales bacterium]